MVNLFFFFYCLSQSHLQSRAEGNECINAHLLACLWLAWFPRFHSVQDPLPRDDAAHGEGDIPISTN